MRSVAGDKPLDAGTGVVCASLGDDGTWLSFGSTHPLHGFVELSALPPFDDALRGVPARVREFRQLMTDPRHGFLAFEPEPQEQPMAWGWRVFGGSRRHVRRYDGWTMTSTVRARPGAPAIFQELVVAGRRDPPRALRLTFRGRLDRPALAEITELNPPPPTGARTVLAVDGSTLRVKAETLPAEIAISVITTGEPALWVIGGERAEALVRLASPDRTAIGIVIELVQPVVERPPTSRRTRPSASAPVDAGRADGHPPVLLVPNGLRPDLRRIRSRAVDYVRGCTALRVSGDRVAIVTDHRILPLSWTRDAYFQALLLLNEARFRGRPELVDVVADHLRWLWLTCDRPGQTWARSHHANGRRKDEAFQADQQLYPLLELTDYWRSTGGLPDLGEEAVAAGGWPGLVSAVLERLRAGLSADSLLPTDENAADDSVAHSYLLANQILAWHCLNRLEELAGRLALSISPGSLAEQIRDATRSAYPVDGATGRLWAYAVDGRGGTIEYHDANDVPTALAPLWGFCAADDPLWLGTMRFAFSAANPGYAAGRLGGLGSRHTPGTWSLGLIQEWAAWSLAGKHEAAAIALERVAAVSFADGSLPEASDPETGRAVARHWFAWPGALFGALLPPEDLAADG